MWARLYATGFQWHVIGKLYILSCLVCIWLLWRVISSHCSSIVRWTFAWENYKSTGTIRVLKHHVLFQTENTIGIPCKRHVALKQLVYACVSFSHSLYPLLYGTDKRVEQSWAGIQWYTPCCSWSTSCCALPSARSVLLSSGGQKSGLMCLSERVLQCCDLSFFSCFSAILRSSTWDNCSLIGWQEMKNCVHIMWDYLLSAWACHSERAVYQCRRVCRPVRAENSLTTGQLNDTRRTAGMLYLPEMYIHLWVVDAESIHYDMHSRAVLKCKEYDKFQWSLSENYEIINSKADMNLHISLYVCLLNVSISLILLSATVPSLIK